MSVSACVTLTLQVEVTLGNWSGKESFEGLRNQATREAKNKLAGALAGNNGMVVVGEPVAMKVVMEDR